MIDISKIHQIVEVSDDSLGEYRKAALQDIGEKIVLPEFRYGSTLRMPMPQVNIENIEKSPDVDLVEEFPEGISINDKFDEDDINILKEDDKSIEKYQLDLLHDSIMNYNVSVTIDKDFNLSRPAIINLKVNSSAVFSTMIIKANKFSKGTLIINYETLDTCKYSSFRIIVMAEEGSNLNVVAVQNASESTIHWQQSRAHALENATVYFNEACMGARYSHEDFFAELDGQGSSIETRVLYLSKSEQKHTITTTSNHNVSQTYSDILTRGVITDKAKALSIGYVRIKENAFDSNGYETQDALLLSEKAEADAIPNLEIHNHDVKCSHGSTVSQIDDEKIFYMKSRGMSEKMAISLIVQGYFNPLLEKVGNDSIKDKVYAQIQRALPE